MFSVKNRIDGNNSNNYLVGNNTPIIDVEGNIEPADDAIYGYGGNDTLLGRGGDDDLFGGNGNDLLRGGDGADRLYGGNQNDKLYGDNGNDRLSGQKGNDLLYGGDGNDSVYGGDGDDVVLGQKGNDTLTGSFGDDYLAGGAYGNGLSGYDMVTGGSGADSFSLQSNSFNHYLGNGYATITDFSSIENDKILVGDYGVNNDNYYSLGTGNWGGSNALDSAIYFQGDLVARVYDDVISLSSDVKYIPYIAG